MKNNNGKFKGLLKRGTAFCAVGVMALSIAACGGKSSSTTTNNLI